MARPSGVTLIVKPCENCGAEVTRRKGTEKAHFFCSRSCYWSSEYRRSVTKKMLAARSPDGRRTVRCNGCGNEFERYTSQVEKTNFCNAACRALYRLENAEPQRTAQGYLKIYVGKGAPGATKTGHIMQHRKVMQDLLGRPLLPEENVHHINGDRSDNRLENLELWSVSQPKGQRVEEKIRWAREFLSLYEGVLNDCEEGGG